MTLPKGPFFSLLITIIIFCAFTLLSVLDIMSKDYFFPALLGFILSLVNFAIGYLSLTKLKKNSSKNFLVYLMGGMLIRMLIMLLLVFICLYFLEINPLSFIFSFLFFYVFFLINEVFYLKSGNF